MHLKSSFLGFALLALTSVACSSTTPAASDDAGNPSGGDAAITPDGATEDSASDAPVTVADGATDSPITTSDAEADSGLDATPD